MEAIFSYFDGNTGNDIIGEYADVMAEMSDMWHHLSISDRKKYTDFDHGAFFCVSDRDTLITIWDVADLIDDSEPSDIDRLGFEISNTGERI